MKKSLVKINDHVIDLDEIESIGPTINISSQNKCVFWIYFKSRKELVIAGGTALETAQKRQRLLGVMLMKGKKLKTIT